MSGPPSSPASRATGFLLALGLAACMAWRTGWTAAARAIRATRTAPASATTCGWGPAKVGLPPGPRERPRWQEVSPNPRSGGQQADATPAPGSNIDALMAGVDQPKPRGIQLARTCSSGNTATDAPTPILPDMGDAQGTAAPRIPVAQAALAGAPSGGLLPPRAEPAIVPQPEPAVVPQPDAAVVPAPPDPTPLIPNPRAGYDQGALANFNGLPQPAAAIVPPIAAAVPPRAETPLVPPPDAAVVPPPPEPDARSCDDRAGRQRRDGRAADNSASSPGPVQGPPIPPGLLARKLSSAV
jgi:hypothetical protein